MVWEAGPKITVRLMVKWMRDSGRKKGRPRRKWIEDDLLSLDIHDWKSKVNNSEKWQKQSEMEEITHVSSQKLFEKWALIHPENRIVKAQMSGATPHGM